MLAKLCDKIYQKNNSKVFLVLNVKVFKLMFVTIVLWDMYPFKTFSTYKYTKGRMHEI